MDNDLIQAVRFFGVLTQEELKEKVALRWYVKEMAWSDTYFYKELKSAVDRGIIKCNKGDSSSEDHLDWYSTVKYYA